jgi:peptidyl-prolyl cis-trans isomerase B (cyclophilin B)
MTVNAIIKRRPLLLVILALAIGLILGFVIGRSLGANSNGGNPRAEITMESGGTIVVELDPASAPITVKNFISLASDGFYNGLTFHRVIPGFMIQGGDPDGTGTGGSSSAIKGEFSDNGVTNNISHVRGVISMARRGNDYDSATSQFFITSADRLDLDGQYAAFGHVVKGMEVIDMISALPTDSNDKPLTDVVIKSIKIIK